MAVFRFLVDTPIWTYWTVHWSMLSFDFPMREQGHRSNGTNSVLRSGESREGKGRKKSKVARRQPFLSFTFEFVWFCHLAFLWLLCWRGPFSFCIFSCFCSERGGRYPVRAMDCAALQWGLLPLSSVKNVNPSTPRVYSNPRFHIKHHARRKHLQWLRLRSYLGHCRVK